jgi:hypothetical protein
MTSETTTKKKFKLWFFEGSRGPSKEKSGHGDAWWRVMCLTGVDYFSSLGYAPGIAFLAANMVSPLASVVLVLLNLLGALPIYAKVAEESPHGQGSIAMLEHLLPRWKGKLVVLVLLGFAATDFIITITLSAADAAAHLAQNPWSPAFLHDRMLVTMFMLTVLGGVFLIGFREAIGISVVLVALYLTLNLIVVCTGGAILFQHPEYMRNWITGLFTQYHSIWNMLGISLVVFPKLALGMSGFETGVAVMPLVEGRADDDAAHPAGRIANTKKLLTTAACIMGFFLISSSLITTSLIAPKEFQEGGQADGRALAYLAHLYLGNYFGTLYDLSTITILWFAGASALAGLLSLVPRYLPKYGMAPNWAAATRPLVLFFTAVAFTVTYLFKADVDAQGGAYATGVLVLMTSAAFASMLVTWRQLKQRIAFALITVIFVYTTITNIIQRPEGIHIATFFISAILLISFVSRVVRSTELRERKIVFDDTAERFIQEAADLKVIRVVAHRPGYYSDYTKKERQARETHNITSGQILFLEVTLSDASEFSTDVLYVHGVEVGTHKILRCESPAVPNAIAAVLLHIRDKTGVVPHLYLGWTEGNPVSYILKYLFFGEGETAPVTREILRQYEPEPHMRPRVHVG